MIGDVTGLQAELDAAAAASSEAIQTTAFTAAAGRWYPCDTTSAAFTATLPASPSQGERVVFTDSHGQFGTNNLTVGRNAQPITGAAADFVLDVSGVNAEFEYIDGTRGWNVYLTTGAT